MKRYSTLVTKVNIWIKKERGWHEFTGGRRMKRHQKNLFFLRLLPRDLDCGLMGFICCESIIFLIYVLTNSKPSTFSTCEP